MDAPTVLMLHTPPPPLLPALLYLLSLLFLLQLLQLFIWCVVRRCKYALLALAPVLGSTCLWTLLTPAAFQCSLGEARPRCSCFSIRFLSQFKSRGQNEGICPAHSPTESCTLEHCMASASGSRTGWRSLSCAARHFGCALYQSCHQ